MRWNLQMGSRTQRMRAWAQEKGLLWSMQLLACMAAAGMVAQCFWLVATPASPTAAPVADATLMEQSERVAARHFFEVAATVQQIAANLSGPVETSWRLLGTYVSSGQHSRAMLAPERGSDVVLAQVGDKLPSGHEVVSVSPEGVVLQKDAQRSELSLRPSARGAEHEPEPPENRMGVNGMTPFTKDSR